MVKGIPRNQENATALYALYFGGDDGLNDFYSVDLGSSPNYIRHDGISRTAVKAEAGASIIGNPVRSVRINLGKYGLPTGNITICVRKISDGTIGDTLGTWPIESFPTGVNQLLIILLEAGMVQYGVQLYLILWQSLSKVKS